MVYYNFAISIHTTWVHGSVCFLSCFKVFYINYDYKNFEELTQNNILLTTDSYAYNKSKNQYLLDINSNYKNEEAKKILKFKGNIIFDKIHPDGTPRKLLDCKLAKRYGWKNHIKLTEGLILTKNELIINFEKYE